MKKYYNLIILIISYLVLTILSKEILNTNDLVISSYAEQFTSEQINEIIGFQKKWEWLGYLFVPLLTLVKVTIIAAILDIGMFFFNIEISYKKLLNIVIKAEFVFLFVIIFKTVWFYIFQQNYTLNDLQYFYPLSALNLIDYNNISSWFIYPFQVINLFEIAYWFILAFLIRKEIKSTIQKGLTIVASSYGVSLLIWVVGVMFFTLNMN